MAEEDRTEEATPKRRQEAREEGQIARSQEVNTAFILAAGFFAFALGARHMLDELTRMTRHIFDEALPRADGSIQGITELMIALADGVVSAVAPIFLAVVIAGLAANILQVGFLITFKAMKPKFSRLNPITGFKNLFFRKQKFFDLFKGILKLVVLGWVAYVTIKQKIPLFPTLYDVEVEGYLVFILTVAGALLKNILIAYALLALLDYVFQRWRTNEDIKMTKQEVKDERKQAEGDPKVRQRIRSIQYEMARRRMMADVPTADVVVTNPVHFAVALRYDETEMEAPTVVAKGAELVAAKIVELAEEHDVPVFRAPPVARALYRQVEIGDGIPGDLFKAVAEILAHVYRVQGRTPGELTGDLL